MTSPGWRRFARLPLISPRLWWRRVAFWGGALLVSVAAIVFARAADIAVQGVDFLSGNVPWLMLVISPLGLAACAWLTQSIFPGAEGSGIPQVIAVLHTGNNALADRMLSLRVATGKVLLTLIGLVCGASIGREGPTVQVGAVIMHGLGRILKLPRADIRRALVLAGGAAGISAAFNTPLAGIVFAIEELSPSFEGRSSFYVMTAVVISGLATLAMAGNYAYFGQAPGASIPFHAGWLVVPVCGLLGGLLGGLFSRVLIIFAEGLPGAIGRWCKNNRIAFAALCGLCIAILGLASHGATYGTGYAQARGVVEGTHTLPAVFVVMKWLATVVSYISGIPGGIFAPSLAVGAALGEVLSHLLPLAPTGTVVLLAMSGYFAGVVQAPITATVIVLEMTQGQNLTIPVMAAAVLGHAASRMLCRHPLYGQLARLVS